MKIIAFDTATESCSVALVEQSRLLAEISLINTETHSRHLASLIRDVCRLAGIELGDIDGYAVTRGPGSFTGLRIGISTAIGLAQASGKPLAGVSTLHTLAAQATAPLQSVCPMIDARRGEVYFSTYRHVEHDLIAQQPEQVSRVQDAIETISEPCIFIGSGAALYQAEISDRMGEAAQFASKINHIIRAATVATLAQKKLVGGETDDVMNFRPTYLRKSDAKINKIAGRKTGN
jgi:tRNA threonylcarbamoyladenosine biosynthesis protein TsaB